MESAGGLEGSREHEEPQDGEAIDDDDHRPSPASARRWIGSWATGSLLATPSSVGKMRHVRVRTEPAGIAKLRAHRHSISACGC